MKNRKREICTSGSVRDEAGEPPHLLGGSAALQRGGWRRGRSGRALSDFSAAQQKAQIPRFPTLRSARASVNAATSRGGMSKFCIAERNFGTIACRRSPPI